MKKYIILLAFAGILLLMSSETAIWAQCPMCKAAAESNIRDGGTHGLGLNAGILYLFTMPYLIVMTIGIIWWWNNKKPST